MPYKQLTETLARVGEDVRVRRAVLMKFGCILVAQVKIPDEMDYPITELEKITNVHGDFPPDISKTIFEALKKHPNIFEAKILDDGASDSAFYGDEAGAVIDWGPVCSFRVDLPKDQQHYQDMHCEEHFRVLLMGSVFAAFVDIGDTPSFTNMGHEFREIARSQIEKETKYKSPVIGPTPFHPDLVLVFNEDRQQARSSPRRAHNIHDDLFIVIDDESSTDSDVIEDIFFDLGGTVGRFYETQLQRDHLIDYNTEVSSHFEDVSSAVTELIQVPSWNVVRTHSLSKTAKISLAKIHARLVELGNSREAFEDSRSDFLQTLRKQPILSRASSYFDNITESHVHIPEALTSALNFFEGELQLYGNIRSLLVASVLGAIVGSNLTGTVTWLIAR